MIQEDGREVGRIHREDRPKEGGTIHGYPALNGVVGIAQSPFQLAVPGSADRRLPFRDAGGG